MTNTQTLDYRKHIDESFQELIAKNPRFSLRSLARRLQMSPAHLSRVLSGKRSLSVQSALQVARALDFSEAKTRSFLKLVEYQAASEPSKEALLKRMIAKNANLKERPLDLEKFQVIADWQHFAVLNLFALKNFKCEVPWIAKRLGLSAPEVRTVLTRLEEVGAVVRNKAGHLVPSEDSAYLATSDDVASGAIKEHHRQILGLAVKSLTEVPLEQREFQSLMLPLATKKIKKAKTRIREFIDQFNREFVDTASDEIFACSVQLFPLTKLNENLKKDTK